MPEPKRGCFSVLSPDRLKGVTAIIAMFYQTSLCCPIVQLSAPLFVIIQYSGQCTENSIECVTTACWFGNRSPNVPFNNYYNPNAFLLSDRFYPSSFHLMSKNRDACQFANSGIEIVSYYMRHYTLLCIPYCFVLSVQSIHIQYNICYYTTIQYNILLV